MTHGAAHLEMGNARNRLIFKGIRKAINCRCAQKCDTCSKRYEGITAFSISYTDHPFPGVQEMSLSASSQDAFVRIIPLPKVRGGTKGKKKAAETTFSRPLNYFSNLIRS